LLQAYLQSRLGGEVHEEQLVMGKVVVDLVAKVLFETPYLGPYLSHI